ncbi:MAG: hypothetical protein ABJA37_10370 [Ferruginibacter sp.]
MKIWKSEEKKDDKIIAYFNQTIYKGNPVPGETDNCIFELQMQKIPNGFFSIPLHYISQINLTDGKEYIEVLFKGSTEHLKIKDSKIRNEIFDYFKENIPGAVYSIDKYSKLRTGKKNLVAMLVVIILSVWSLYYATGMEAGNEYDVSGGHYNSIAGIILLIASLGVTKIILISGSLLVIIIIAFIRKIKNPRLLNAYRLGRGKIRYSLYISKKR